MQDDEIQDPLKSLDKIYEPDERQSSFIADLPDIHKSLASITLNDAVPLAVKQLFETAKNLSLYTWFVYRFHQPAELISFAAMEMALRQRYLSENPDLPESQKKKLSLYKLLQHAKKEKWLRNEGFKNRYAIALHNAEIKKASEALSVSDLKEGQSLLLEDPTEEEIALAMSELDMVAVISDHAHIIRNNLAHGSETLHWNSIGTIALNAEVINQIYTSFTKKLPHIDKL